MKKYIYISIAILFGLLILLIIGLKTRLEKEIKEKVRLENNQSYLLNEVERYKNKDSLNIVSLTNLELTLKEYKKYRQEDLKLIESLKIDKKRIESVNTIQAQTISELNIKLNDSIVTIIENDTVIKIEAQCFDYKTEFTELSGCIIDSTFIGELKHFEKLKCIEHIIPKKFLFFKCGVKERRIEIVSLNKDTEITSVDFVRIKK